MKTQTTRRTFLKATAAAGTVLLAGLRPDGAAAVATEAHDFNPVVRVTADGRVTVIIKHFEVGRGTTTELAALVAEELDADWDQVAVEFTPADGARYKNLLFGAEGAGGSTAIADSYLQYRKAGAAAREVLGRAAAETWGVDPSVVTTNAGVLSAGGHSAGFARDAWEGECAYTICSARVEVTRSVPPDRRRWPSP